MGRHRLFSAQHGTTSYTRVHPDGHLYDVLKFTFWITPPAGVTSIPAIFTDHDHSPL